MLNMFNVGASANHHLFSTLCQMKVMLFFLFISFLFLSSCSGKRTTVVLLPDDDNVTGKIELKNEHGKTLIVKPRGAVVMKLNKPPARPTEMSEEKMYTIFSEVIDAAPEKPQKFILYFEQGSDSLTVEGQRHIPRIIETIKARQSMDISISGHSDRLGDEAFNENLSLKRANKVLEKIIEKGIDPSFIRTSSHGEGNPVVPTEDNVAEPLNRRVEVIIR